LFVGGKRVGTAKKVTIVNRKTETLTQIVVELNDDRVFNTRLLKESSSVRIDEHPVTPSEPRGAEQVQSGPALVITLGNPDAPYKEVFEVTADR
jgi:hypothetical protein